VEHDPHLVYADVAILVVARKEGECHLVFFPQDPHAADTTTTTTTTTITAVG